MDKTTIDRIVLEFEHAYHKNKNNLYLDKSLDKYAQFSKEYVDNISAILGVNDLEKKEFNSYFENYIKSKYRRDFERDVIIKEENEHYLTKRQAKLIYATWSVIFGSVGSALGFAITRSEVGAIAGTIVGVGIGVYLADSAIREGVTPPEKIVGTPEYENKIIERLYVKLLDTNNIPLDKR